MKDGASAVRKTAESLIQQVVDGCGNPPGLIGGNEFELKKARWLLNRGLDDCLELDRRAGGMMFTGRFMDSLQSERVFAGVLWIATEPINKKTVAPVWEAMREGKTSGKGAEIICLLRELLRDGSTIDNALRQIAPHVGKQAEAGNVKFFARSLPEVLKEFSARPERFQRGIRDWIRRAWIPLVLWDVAHDRHEVHRRLKDAAALLPEISFPDIDNAGFRSFEDALRKFRAV